MHKNFGPIINNYDDDFDMDDYNEDKNFGNNFTSYPEHNRYSNAYGNYRGGYDRSNQCPPLGFGANGPMRHAGSLGSHGLPFQMGDTRWRRGYPPGPPDNVTRANKREKMIKFLMRCGIAREHVINLPNDVLWMMHPMNCGLCSQQFETNELSRIHYASKNHLKNQKKWLNQRSNSGSQGREPLKSRDLYCELCDVHITSVGHADSHYAGKSHRSIVEGRKNPRNPFLLQPHKQGRLKALIRREMKFLKKYESAPGAKKKKVDIKSNDLYCEICKTSMMCSEQMTTHLNGKRHLSKEKQHILRLMKGEVSDHGKKKDNKTAENANRTADMEGDDDDEDYGDKEEDGDEEGQNEGMSSRVRIVDAADDDWGEGGEDWKPSAEDY